MKKCKNYQLKLCNLKWRAKHEEKSKMNDKYKIQIYTTHSYGNKLYMNLVRLKQNSK